MGRLLDSFLTDCGSLLGAYPSVPLPITRRQRLAVHLGQAMKV